MMYLREGYRSGGQDGAAEARGQFIILFQEEWGPERGPVSPVAELRVLVRAVKMTEFGNFMLGRIKVKIPGRVDAVALTLSGAFGGDNLPVNCPPALWDHVHPVPQDVADRYWNASEGNEPGAGAQAIVDWVVQQGDVLKRLCKNGSSERPAE
jgi:hypothetical protein